jgi:glutamine synthetase
MAPATLSYDTSSPPNSIHFSGNSTGKPPVKFGSSVFSTSVIEKMLPKEAYLNIINARKGREKIRPEYADTIAVAMREWALSLGATHYSHWFQPLTSSTAEKHESFVDWKTPDVNMEKFSGKELLQGEPDASSFPSGGLRTTYEARGYTGWDPTSPPFIWEAGDGITLCIPSIFFSWTGDVLDNKIPLLRSDTKINEASLRLLKLTGTEATQVYSNLGWEQEYFIVDKKLYEKRPDLMIAGKTVIGAPSPKGQELQDHYFGAVKDRVLSFMKDFEEEALKLAIPVKTRHNEVAPAQYEIAPIFEKASISVDHNILMMELMRRIALKHGLVCLLHEKPYANLNGSGKHNNWSLATNKGLNLLDPTDYPEKSIQFLILLTAVLSAVHRHEGLLRASIASAGNDSRLGGHEAPPAIISIYLGETLENLLNDIENETYSFKSHDKVTYELGIPVIPDLTKDTTDRNRTSPLAFTGNKFEFRAVGSAASCALPITILNAIVAESINTLCEAIEKNLDTTTAPTSEQLALAALPVVRDTLIASKNIRFNGDNYSSSWLKEARKRGLSNVSKAYHAFTALRDTKTIQAFKDILTRPELESRYDIFVEQYSHHINIEAKLMIELFHTFVLPAAFKHQKIVAKSIHATENAGISKGALSKQKEYLSIISEGIETAITLVQSLEKKRIHADAFEGDRRGKAFCDEISTYLPEVRTSIDFLETLIDDELWTLPKYRELLFLV